MARNTLNDFRWVPIDGQWESGDGGEITFIGGEYDPPAPQEAPPQEANQQQEHPSKFVNGGTIIFGQRFREGRMKMQVEFEQPDHRSRASILLQYDVESKDMLTFDLTGGQLRPAPGVVGFMYKLQLWAAPPLGHAQTQQGSGPALSKVWTPLFQTGIGTNLIAKQRYDLEVVVRGSAVTLLVDDVEIGKHSLAIPSLPGHSCGIFCLDRGRVHFRNISVETTPPKAFVVMQFNTPEFEALFHDVIEPICQSLDLQAYRADFTYMPGLVIEDIKKHIMESRVVIAEITPANPNVYYEVGYADALRKPIILISDRRDGIKPFDVRAYRTIFYENSIGGKNRIENELQAYLQSILEN
ncbi:hypothetical protein [Methylocapsa acidiphila]|uniref:hypothetical protein n=1 Tax=Methylocapsa acidiphila TaxID=133552 RepID=UPI0012EB4E9B|nr:hypothetical protein [Methylocapsa acidiphila]